MPLVTITGVRHLETRPEDVVRFELDAPSPGAEADAFTIKFEGCVVARSRKPVSLELSGAGVDGERLPIGVLRHDLGEAYPDIRWAASNSGFQAQVGALRLPKVFEFVLAVVLAGGERVPVAAISGERADLESPVSVIDPVLITTIGRTGSSLVLRLLAEHPEILTYRPRSREVKVASYWADIFVALAEPRSYQQPISSMLRGSPWWLADARPFDEKLDDDAPLEQWLGSDHVERVADFCRDRITAFYARLFRSEQESPRYFAEKCIPKVPAYPDILRHLFPGTREIILVRDFRDMLCSILAYNRRAGENLFGRENFETDEDYVRGFVRDQANFVHAAWMERGERAHLLRYEDVLSDSTNTLDSLFSYLDLDWSTDILEASLLSDRARAEQRGHGTSADGEKSIGRWRTELDPSLQRVCEESFGEVLANFGYST